jgi:surfeit locus 1 family protein
MRLAGIVFRPRWWALALAVAGCAAGVALGNWQWGRAGERRAAAAALQAAERAPALELPRETLAPASLAPKRVAVRGEFLPGYTVLLDFRVHRGRPGYHVVQPMRIGQSGRHVIVLRGWVAAGARRDQLPALVTPAGEQRIEGIALERLPQFFEPSGATDRCRPGPLPCVWQNLRIDSFGVWSGLALEPFLLEQRSELRDGLERDWERAEAGFRKNQMYALQWYSLAALSVALFVVLSFRREKPAVR